MIKATKYEVEDLGRYFKTSKKKYKWSFLLENKDHYLELEFSYLSGKRKLMLDGRPLHESMMLTSSFQYPFTLEGFALNVIQQGDSFELRINNKVFSHLYTQQKTQNEFVYEENKSQTDDAQSNSWAASQNQPQFNEFGAFSNQQNNKFSLNIKLDKKKEEDEQFTYNKSKSLAQPQTASTSFGTFGNQKFEDFDSFGQFSAKPNQQTIKGPFDNFSGFSNFSPNTDNQDNKPQQQNIQATNAKVDLLDLDDPAPMVVQPQIQQEVPKQNLADFNITQTQQPQDKSLFDAFANTAQIPIPIQPQANIMNLYAPQPQMIQQQNFNMAYNQFPQQPQQFPQQPQQFPQQPQQYNMQQQQFQMNQDGFIQQPVYQQNPNQGFVQPPMNQQAQYQQAQVASTPFDLFK